MELEYVVSGEKQETDQLDLIVHVMHTHPGRGMAEWPRQDALNLLTGVQFPSPLPGKYNMRFVDMRELQDRFGGLGQFYMDRRSLYTMKPGAIQAIMFGLIVVSAEIYWEGNKIIYRAFGPEFEYIKSGNIIPEYEVVVTEQKLELGEIIYHVKWTKKEH